MVEHQLIIVKNFKTGFHLDKICCMLRVIIPCFSCKFTLQQGIIYITHSCIMVNHALTDFSILGFTVPQDGDSFYTSQ